MLSDNIVLLRGWYRHHVTQGRSTEERPKDGAKRMVVEQICGIYIKLKMSLEKVQKQNVAFFQ